ncbi:NUDIX hydrolase [Pseudoscardovia suis]|uniref:NUDIX domain-containing protein n=1 Tax=Pseudoscardovia suis TaxID=987063 RepID=A0A261F4C2_9BIFI|nr:NUDIX hydrolase [Pseudoscardovia suis]OZG53954.1 NUDIX domain-containing protein [Pseudoscardovia suis]PJJ65807.1 mutator protein MutT [Pseudoscardovia suis]
MTTPGDVARMLRHANSWPRYASTQASSSQDDEEEARPRPLYSSQSPQPAAPSARVVSAASASASASASAGQQSSASATDSGVPAKLPKPASPTPGAATGKKPRQRAHRAPHHITPAVMAGARRSTVHVTFATLGVHNELPVVREYSAGGLIFDSHGRVAVIARHSRSGHLEWCLPKGHIEKGETPEQTAVREVHEETGISGEVIESIATIDYWFTGTTQRIHKLVHHFALRMTGGELTVAGDPDHEAEDVKWVAFDELDSVLSYPNERRIASMYARKRKFRQ